MLLARYTRRWLPPSSSTRVTNSPTTRAAHTRDSSARKFPDVTTNQYNRTTSPVRFLPGGGNSTVGFTACTSERGDAPTRHTLTDRAALVRVGWSPPLHDIPPTRFSAVPSRLDNSRPRRVKLAGCRRNLQEARSSLKIRACGAHKFRNWPVLSVGS